MKKIFLVGLVTLLSYIKIKSQTINYNLNDGTYQVISLLNDSAMFKPLLAGQVIIPFDTIFNPGEYKKVVIDTLDYVPMELASAPSIELQSNNKKLLSVTLTPEAAEKMKSFTSKRVMKQVVIVFGGKAITMHKIREAITGNKMQITRCTDNACEHLLVIMKKSKKK